MKANINNITLNYLKGGNGNPLILLHGNGEDLHIFDKLIDKLKEKFTVYAIDSRNHGESTKTEDYTYETMCEDIRLFIQELKLEKVSVIGFSDGAIVTLLLTLKQPQIFKKMVLLGINLKPTDFKPDAYNYLVHEYEKTKDPLFKMMLEQPNIDLNELKKVQTPTLLVRGENDLFDESSFQNMVDIMPNAELRIMENHDHSSYIVDNDIILPYLEKFL